MFSVCFSRIVVNCFSCSSDVSLCNGDSHSLLSAVLLFKGSVNGLVK